MSESKKYYWIKLKTDFFDQDTIDFIMGQENGAKYVVIYQMLMLKTAQQDGFLATKANELLIPYDIKKIVRDTKYFDYDTVAIALELFKKLGLVYEEENNVLKLAGAEDLVGYETKWAEKKRAYREKKENRTIQGQIEDNVRQDIEIEKDIEIDIDKDKDISINNSNSYKSNVSGTRKTKVFQKPSNQDVLDYCNSIGHGEFDIEKFIDYYESNGWKVGKNPMKDWKAAVRNWIRKAETEQKNNTQKKNDEERGFWF